jgi:type I restriction enzyme S subunit
MAAFSGATEETVSASAIGNGTRLAPPEAIFIAVRGMSLHNEIRVVRPAVAMTFNQDIKAVVPNGIDGRFLYYVLMARREHLLASVESAGHGTGRLPTDRLESLLVPDFSAAEQRAIAAVLGALDDKIELNRRMNEALEAMARAIFKDWFVDFGPTRAKMDGRAPYLAPDLWSLFPARLDEDGKPEGWITSPFSEVVEVIGGGTPRTSESRFWNGTIPWFSVVDAPSDGQVWVTATEKTITEAGLDACSARLLPRGVTILSARGTVGRTALVGHPMAMNQSCYALKGRRERFGYFTYFSTRQLIGELRTRAHGSVFDTITRDTLAGVSIAMPKDDVIAMFEDKTGPLLERVLLNIHESRTLAATRDLLLPKLMSGEIRVKDAERFAEGAA